MSFVYLIALTIAITGMVLLDRRFRLFFWRDARRAAIVLAAGLVFFLAWDVAGINLGIFLRGESLFATGWLIAPQLPIEEPVFLVLLAYLAMNLYAGSSLLMSRLVSRRRSGHRPPVEPAAARSRTPREPAGPK